MNTLLFTLASFIFFTSAFAEAPVAGDLAFHEVTRQSIPKERVLDAVVEAVHEATVSAQTSGTIEAILFDVDDSVEKGAELLRFRDSEQRAALSTARAVLAEAEALNVEARDEDARVAKVFAEGAVSRSALDRSEARRKAAEARLEAARAGVARAGEQLAYTVVRAPYSGIVTAKHVQVGEFAKVSDPLMTGVSLDALRVSADMPQHLMEQARTSDDFWVVAPGSRRSVRAGKVTFFPHANPHTHTFRVRAYLPEGTPGLYPGMFVKLRFKVGERARLVLPARAVIRRGEMQGVYTVDAAGRVALRLIRARSVPAAGGPDAVEVLSGLAEGERVALDPILAGVRRKEGFGL